jgi:ferritin-like metal-binding protein YciE
VKIQNLNDVLAHELRELLGAEECIDCELKKIIARVTDPELSECLMRYREQADGCRRRLKKVLSDLNEKPKALDCCAVQGMFEGLSDSMKAKKLGASLADIYAAGGTMKIIGYEIACHEDLITAARELGLDQLNVDEQLERNLDEHRETLTRLQRIAQRLLKEEVTFPSDDAVNTGVHPFREFDEDELEPVATPIEPEQQQSNRTGSAQAPSRSFDDEDEMEDEVPEESSQPARPKGW